jgi:hypothetical protein
MLLKDIANVCSNEIIEKVRKVLMVLLKAGNSIGHFKKMKSAKILNKVYHKKFHC